MTTQNAIRRLSAFSLLKKLIEVAPNLKQVVLEVFTDLQGETSSSCSIHYTEGIKGCGTFIEEKIQALFFSIMSHLPSKLQESPDDQALLKLLEWKFHARDFSHLLEELPIFKMLQTKGETRYEQLLETKDSQA